MSPRLFDTTLEAIRRGIETKGYELDRYWLPWTESASSVAAAPASSDPSNHAAELKDKPKDGTYVSKNTTPSKQPGSILFRRSEEVQAGSTPSSSVKLLLLLLVAETPTTGIDKEQFWAALDLAARLARYRRPADRPWCVIGPSFSGSADSLALTLGRWVKQHAASMTLPPPAFWVCSGASTNLDKKRFEELAKPARALLAATVIPDEILLDEVIRWFSDRGDLGSTKDRKETLLLLVEAGTGYGQWAFDENREPKQAVQEDKAPGRKEIIAAPRSEEATKAKSGKPQSLVIPFPLHISQVRGMKGAEYRDPIVAQQRGHVPIPLDDVPEARDQIPSLTPKMTTSSDSLIASNILGTIFVHCIGVRTPSRSPR